MVLAESVFYLDPLTCGNGWVISAYTLLGMCLLIHAAIEVEPR